MGKTIEELLRSGEDALEKRDYKTAMADYKAAADMGSAEAFVCLGNIYIEGFACRRNIDAAMGCYKKAAEMGNAEGMYGVAKCYRSGYGIDVEADNAYELYSENIDKFLKWYEKAADNGNIKAMISLAELYIQTREGFYAINMWDNMEMNLEKVVFWYNKAIEQADITDKSALAEINYRIGKDVLFYHTTDKAAVDFAQTCAEQALALGHRKAAELMKSIENRDQLIEMKNILKAQHEAAIE